MAKGLLRRKAPAALLLALTGVAGTHAGAREASPGTEWRHRSPREEIAPRFFRDSEVTVDGIASLGIAGTGQSAVDGSWTRRFALTPGSHVRFEVRYRAKRVEEPLRSVLARFTWRTSGDKAVGPAEYPRTAARDARDGWSAIRGTYLVPPTAAAADVELQYRWDADGEVRFSGARLDPVPPPPPRRVRLGTIHHRPRGSRSPEENIEAFLKLVAEAARQHADIVCLPEGITVVGTGKTYVEVSEPVPGPTTRRLGEASRAHSVYIVAGIYERERAAVYNTAVLVGRDGKVAGKYRKVCLPREEIDGGITPGDRFPVFDLDFGRVGLMVCWDVFFPEPARALGRQGAEVIFLPIWGGDLTLARARAIENQAYLVTSTYDMKTAVFDRRGEILAEGTEDRPVVVVEVDLSERTMWPWLGDFRGRIPREAPPRAVSRARAQSSVR